MERTCVLRFSVRVGEGYIGVCGKKEVVQWAMLL